MLELNGLASLSGALAPDVTLGLATGNGAGNITVAYDEYKGQLLIAAELHRYLHRDSSQRPGGA